MSRYEDGFMLSAGFFALLVCILQVTGFEVRTASGSHASHLMDGAGNGATSGQEMTAFPGDAEGRFDSGFQYAGGAEDSRKILTRKIQAGLDLLGYDPGSIDGICGRETSKAIEVFQKRHGLIINGEVSRSLLESIEEELRKTAGKRRRVQHVSRPPSFEPGDPLAVARGLYNRKEYDEVIRMLSKVSTGPEDYETSVLLARARLKKCESLKADGDRGYGKLVMEPYQTGLKLYRKYPNRPEPYHIIAFSLLVNNRPNKAARYIKRAIRISPDNWEYYLVLGDASYDQMGPGKDYHLLQDIYLEGKYAYEKSLEISAGDEELASMIREKLQRLSEKMKLNRGAAPGY